MKLRSNLILKGPYNTNVANTAELVDRQIMLEITTFYIKD